LWDRNQGYNGKNMNPTEMVQALVFDKRKLNIEILSP